MLAKTSARHSHRRVFAAFLFGFVVLGTGASASRGQGLQIETRAGLDQSNSIRNHLMRVADEVTQDSLGGIRTLEDWERARPAR